MRRGGNSPAPAPTRLHRSSQGGKERRPAPSREWDDPPLLEEIARTAGEEAADVPRRLIHWAGAPDDSLLPA